MNKEGNTSKYLDGIVRLHKNLSESFEKARHISDLYIPKSNEYIENPVESDDCIPIYINAKENDYDRLLEDYIVYGYFMFDGIIHRFLRIKLDIAALFTVHDFSCNKNDACGIGITAYETKTFFPRGDDLVLVFKKFEAEGVKDTIYEKLPFMFKPFEKKDDVGNFFKITDVNEISVHPIQQDILKKFYHLVDVSYYAPYTASEVFCVLYAEIDNIHDINAIKVLRWFPQSRNHDKYDLWGEVFFELGYISSKENIELHSYMIRNNCRILFGRVFESLVKIIGGFEIFLNNDFRLPKCLLKNVL